MNHQAQFAIANYLLNRELYMAAHAIYTELHYDELAELCEVLQQQKLERLGRFMPKNQRSEMKALSQIFNGR